MCKQTYNASDLIKNKMLEIGDGYRAKNSEMGKYGLPFARAGNIKGGFQFSGVDLLSTENIKKAGNKISRPGDVVFTSKGTVGRFALVKEETEQFVYSPQICYWRVLDPEAINPEYLFYWMQSSGFLHQVHKVKGLTDMADYVSLTDQRKMDLTLPDKVTQDELASILSAYDNLIENNNRRIAILEEMTQSLYREWFVKFRFPGHEQAKFIDSPLGKRPEGWKVQKLKDVAEVNPESITKKNVPEEIQYVDIKSVSSGSIDDVKPMPFLDAPSRARRIVQDGDIIWATVRPNRKQYSYISKPEPNTIVSTGFAVIRALSVPSPFLLQVLTTDDFVSYLVNHASGAAYPAVNASEFENADTLIPNEAILMKFDSFAAPMIQQCETLKRKNRNLTAQRDLTLPKLITGQIKF